MEHAVISSWRQKVSYDGKKCVIRQKVRHDVKNKSRHEKFRHDVNKLVMMATSVSWRQKVCPDVK